MYGLQKRVVYIILAMSLVLLGVFVMTSGKDLQILEKIETKEYREFWVSRVDKVGALEAYEEFKQINESVSIGNQHLASHVIGDVLYEKEGINGVTICDLSFGFGCFHGFFGVALSTEGTGSVSDLDTACVNSFGVLGTGCMHGIGHGILEFFGYDRLDDALDMCGDTTQVVSILGCTSGVFMEYNTPLEETNGGGLVTRPRLFDEKNAYGPCISADDQYKESCYFELGSWWALSIGEDWKRMEGLCAGLSHTENARFCMLGVGYSLGNMSDYDVDSISFVCDSMDRESRLHCRSGSHFALWSNPMYRENAANLCEVFEGNEKGVCLEEGRPDLWVNF